MAERRVSPCSLHAWSPDPTGTPTGHRREAGNEAGTRRPEHHGLSAAESGLFTPHHHLRQPRLPAHCPRSTSARSPPTVTQPRERPAPLSTCKVGAAQLAPRVNTLPTSTSLAQLWPRRPVCSQVLPSHRPHRAPRPRHAEPAGAGQGQRTEDRAHRLQKEGLHRHSENRSYRPHRPLSSQHQVTRTNPGPAQPSPSHRSWPRGHPADILTWVPPPPTTCHQAEPLAFSLLGSCKTPPPSLILSLAGIKPQEKNISWN